MSLNPRLCYFQY